MSSVLIRIRWSSTSTTALGKIFPIACCGRNERWHAGNAGLLRAKGSTYEGGLRVPGIFRWPNVIPKDAILGNGVDDRLAPHYRGCGPAT